MKIRKTLQKNNLIEIKNRFFFNFTEKLLCNIYFAFFVFFMTYTIVFGEKNYFHHEKSKK